MIKFTFMKCGRRRAGELPSNAEPPRGDERTTVPRRCPAEDQEDLAVKSGDRLGAVGATFRFHRDAGEAFRAFFGGRGSGGGVLEPSL